MIEYGFNITFAPLLVCFLPPAACKEKQNPSEPDQGDVPSDDTKNHNKKKQKKKGQMKREDATEQTTEPNKTEEDTETSTETSQATVETPAGSGGDAVTQQGEETHKVRCAQ